MDYKAELLHRHKEERRSLQAKIQGLKKSTPKGSKAKTNELHRLIANMEAELTQRHTNELDELTSQLNRVQIATNDNCVPTAITTTVITQPTKEVNSTIPVLTENHDHDNAITKVKSTKAARRREKLQLAEHARMEALAKAEAISATTPKAFELKRVQQILTQRGLVLYEVPSDGDCLYSSISHQLELRPDTLGAGEHVDVVNLNASARSTARFTVKHLRKLTADYIRENVDDCAPFMFNFDTGEPMLPSEVDKYCAAIENTSTWGGQLEIHALSRVLKVPIEVIQAEASPIIVGEELGAVPLTIVYLRHAFALGEHYNSCCPQANEQKK